MSGVCYPDSLIGTIPNIYYYAANNPSGAPSAGIEPGSGVWSAAAWLNEALTACPCRAVPA